MGKIGCQENQLQLEELIPGDGTIVHLDAADVAMCNEDQVLSPDEREGDVYHHSETANEMYKNQIKLSKMIPKANFSIEDLERGGSKEEEEIAIIGKGSSNLSKHLQQDLRQQKQQHHHMQQIQRQHLQYHQQPQPPPPQRHHHQQQQQHHAHPQQPHVPSFTSRQMPVPLPAIPTACFVPQVSSLQPNAVDFLPISAANQQQYPLQSHQVIGQLPLQFPAIVSNQPQSAVPLAHTQTQFSYDAHNLICNQNLMQQLEWQMQIQKQHLHQQLHQQRHLQQIPYQNSVFYQQPLKQLQQQHQQQQLHFLQTHQMNPPNLDQCIPQDQQKGTDHFQSSQNQKPQQLQTQQQKKHSSCDSQTPGTTSTQGVNLYVKHLGDDVDDNTLKKMFSRFGEVVSAKVMMEGQKSRGFGFVCFARAEDAARATRDIRRKTDDLSKKNLYVAPAQKKEERQAFFRERLKSFMEGTTQSVIQEQEMNPKPSDKDRNTLDESIGKILEPPHILTEAGENTTIVSKDNPRKPSSNADNCSQYITYSFNPGELTSLTLSTDRPAADQRKNIFDLENFSLEKLKLPLIPRDDSSFQDNESQSEPIPEWFFEADDENSIEIEQEAALQEAKETDVDNFQSGSIRDQNDFSRWPSINRYSKVLPIRGKNHTLAKSRLCPNVLGDDNKVKEDDEMTTGNGFCKQSDHENLESNEEVFKGWTKNVWNCKLITKDENQILNEEQENVDTYPENLHYRELVNDCIACCTDTDSSFSAEEDDTEQYYYREGQRYNNDYCFLPLQNGQNNSNIDDCRRTRKRKRDSSPCGDDKAIPIRDNVNQAETDCLIPTQDGKDVLTQRKRKRLKTSMHADSDSNIPLKRKRTAPFDHVVDGGSMMPKRAKRRNNRTLNISNSSFIMGQ